MKIIVDIAVNEYFTKCILTVNDVFQSSYTLSEYSYIFKSIQKNEKVIKYKFDRSLFIMNPLDSEFGQSDFKLSSERYSTEEERRIYEKHKDKFLVDGQVIISGSSFEIN